MADDNLMAAIAAVECIYVSSAGDTKALAEAAHEHLLKVDAQRDEMATALAAATERAETMRAWAEDYRSQRDAARALLREVLPWLDGFDNVGDLRARIEAHLEGR